MIEQEQKGGYACTGAAGNIAYTQSQFTNYRKFPAATTGEGEAMEA